MDELTANRNGVRSSDYLAFTIALCFISVLALSILSLISGIQGWGEGIVLVGLSSLVILSITPEIRQFREFGVIRRTLLLFIIAQVISGILIGAYLTNTISQYSEEVWSPAGLSIEQQANEVLKMLIGVSEDLNLLPLMAWIISFHGIFISTMTGISFFASVPAGLMVLLGFLWGRNSSLSIPGYAFVLAFVVSIGFEGVLHNSRRAGRGGLPQNLFSGKGREIMVLSLAALLLAPFLPDLRDVTPIEEIWNLNSTGTGNQSRALLRFSTVYQFVGDVRPDFSPALKVETTVPHYWRGIVFVNYTGREFLSEGEDGTFYKSGQRLPTGWGGAVNRTMQVAQEFTYLQNFPGVLLAAYEPKVVNNARGFVAMDSLTLITRGSHSGGDSYQVLSESAIPDPTILREIGYAQGQGEFLQLPESLPSRVGEMAREVTDGMDNPFDMALAIAQHLRTFQYDLRIDSIPPGRDVVDYFLFDLQAGYCQHFAAAMTVLCRELGIPARVVTGFGSGSYDEDERAYVILQLNFHAWVELYFDDFGWVAFDPTPGGVGGPNIEDAAEVGGIFEGIIPFHGTIEREPTSIYVTSDLEYITEDEIFRIEGVVIQGSGETAGVSRVPVNVTLYTEGLDIFPVMVWPQKIMPILVLPVRTYSDGSFSALCSLPPGIMDATPEARLRVICEGNDLYEPSSVNIIIPIRRKVVLSLEIERGDPLTLVARLSEPGGPIEGEIIEIFLDGEGIGQLVTNSSGMASMTIDIAPGERSLGARYDGNATLGAASSSLIIDTSDQGGGIGGGRRLYLGWILLALAAIPVGFYLLRRKFGPREPDSIARQYGRMLVLLSKAGIGRPQSRTPHEFLLLVEERSGNVYRQVSEITEKFVEATYAGSTLTPTELGEVELLLSEIKESLVRRRSLLGSARIYLRSFIRDILPGG